MSTYRSSAFVRVAGERCDVCGLELEAVEVDDDDAPWRGIALETLIAYQRARVLRERKHGDHESCPGPPRVRIVPLWRALLDLIVL